MIERCPDNLRIGARRLDTPLRNKWEASVDRRPIGRAPSKEGAWRIAARSLLLQHRGGE